MKPMKPLTKAILLILALCFIAGAQCKPGLDPFTGLFVACSGTSAGPTGPTGPAGAAGATGATGATGAVGGSGYCDISTGGSIGATPTFNAASCNSVSGYYSLFTNATTVLATNVTSANYSNLSAGLVVTRIYQNASAAKTLSWGTVNGGGSVIGGCIVTPVLGGTTMQIGFFDGTNLQVNGNCLNDEPPFVVRCTARSAPSVSTITSGLAFWCDSTTFGLQAMDTNAQQYFMPMGTTYASTGVALNPPMLNPLASPITNKTTTGTTINTLTKYSGGLAVIMATTDLHGAAGICTANCGTSNPSTATITKAGNVRCQFDATVPVLDDYVTISSTTAGNCHTAGSFPPANQVIGRVLEACGANSPCKIDLWPQTPSIYNGTTASIGGGALAAGACASNTATITGATTAMVATASPVSYPGDGTYWVAYVSASNTITVKVCAAVALTPSASAYNVRLLQ